MNYINVIIIIVTIIITMNIIIKIIFTIITYITTIIFFFFQYHHPLVLSSLFIIINTITIIFISIPILMNHGTITTAQRRCSAKGLPAGSQVASMFTHFRNINGTIASSFVWWMDGWRRQLYKNKSIATGWRKQLYKNQAVRHFYCPSHYLLYLLYRYVYIIYYIYLLYIFIIYYIFYIYIIYLSIYVYIISIKSIVSVRCPLQWPVTRDTVGYQVQGGASHVS